MQKIANIETSFTLVNQNLIKHPLKESIGVDNFASADQHFIINDLELGELLYAFAMAEGLSLAKLTVGNGEGKGLVEFFWLDLKRARKEIFKLKKILSKYWVNLLYGVELARADSDEFFSEEVSIGLDSISDFCALRRFIINATEPTILLKKKRTILLFHHAVANIEE